jgi:hypothetical protein
MESRNFKLDTEWNMIHYSEKPNGFGILIIGDDRHFVDEQKSFWVQNEGKHFLLDQLRHAGYTCFYSNLYGKHWGNKKSTRMAERLYHHITRTEILNNKIHIIAEGMGALVALELLRTLKDEIRSIVFLNPILSLKTQLELEKEHKFFYKKLLREIAAAYQMDLGGMEAWVSALEYKNAETPTIPIKVIQILSGRRSYQLFEDVKKTVGKWEIHNKSIHCTFLLPEKKQHLGGIISSFFQQYEKDL